MKDIFEAFFTIIGCWLAVMAALAIVFLPMMYFDGTAKAEYLKRTRGMDMPWYRATFLTVHVNDVEAEVHNK